MLGLSKEVDENGVISKLIRVVFDDNPTTNCEFAWKGLLVCWLVPHAIIALIVVPVLMVASFVGYDQGLSQAMDVISTSTSMLMLTYTFAFMLGFMLTLLAGIVVVLLVAIWVVYSLITGEWRVDMQQEKLSEGQYLPWFNNSFRKAYRKIIVAKEGFTDKYCSKIKYK